MSANLSQSPFGIRQNERVAVYIDGPSFFSTCKEIELDVDFNKLLEHFRSHCVLYRITYYLVLPEDRSTPNQVFKLKHWLECNGYQVVSKTSREIRDDRVEGGVRKSRVNLHCEIGNEMLSTAFSNRADRMVLFSADPDLVDAVRRVQERGVNVTLVSSLETRFKPGNELRSAAAGGFVELDDDSIVDIVERKGREIAIPSREAQVFPPIRQGGGR